MFLHKKGTSRISVENCLSHSVEGIRGETFCVSEKILCQKKLYIKGDYRHFLLELFVSQSLKLHTGTLQCFRKYRVSKKFTHRKRISQISVDYFLSHNAENLHTATLQCFRKLRVSKTFVRKRGIPRAGDTRMLKLGCFA